VTVAFFKLQVAGDGIILVDRSRPGHEEIRARPDLLSGLAAAMADSRRGVGGRGVAFVDGTSALDARVFSADGKESYSDGDALLCIARWAFDSGRTAAGKVRIGTPAGERILSALDSRSFAVELPAPPLDGVFRMELLLDGLPETAFSFDWHGRWAASIGGLKGATPKRVREALAAAFPGSAPVVVRPVGRELVRFATADGADRVCAAALAVAAGILAGKTDSAAVAEWRGRGAAVAYADFGVPQERPAELPSAGPGSLIDRGRFYADWKRPGAVLAAGIAEYAFEGSFDYYP
jgi:hypothetical protein